MAEVAATISGQTWRTLITLAPTPFAPIAVSHAPFLARGQLGPGGRPMSSILYPTGMRSRLAAALGYSATSFEIRGDSPPTTDRPAELVHLEDRLSRFATLEPLVQAQVLACLNCLTEQRLIPRLALRLSTAHFESDAGCTALYEAARGMVRLRPTDRPAKAVLQRLAGQVHFPWVAASAAVQLGAAAIRIERDLDQATAALSLAERARSALDADAPDPPGLIASRYHRLRALVLLNAGDVPLATEAMERAHGEASELARQTASAVPTYAGLVAAENLKIVYESYIKAASGGRDATGFARWATRLVDLDPHDPYTWRYIAVYGARCGLATAAALASIGLATTGGPGVADCVAAFRRSPARSEPAGASLADTLAQVLDRWLTTTPSPAEPPRS